MLAWGRAGGWGHPVPPAPFSCEICHFGEQSSFLKNPPGDTPSCWVPWACRDPVACLDVPSAPGRLHCASLNGLIISNYVHSSWSVGSPGQGMGFSLGIIPGAPRVSPKWGVLRDQDTQGYVPKAFVPRAGVPRGQHPQGQFPKQRVLRGPSRTGPQSSCLQSGGPKGPGARSLKSLSHSLPPSVPAPQNPHPRAEISYPTSPKPRSC